MHMNKILAQMLILIGNITYSESKSIGSFCEPRSTRKLWFLIIFCLWHPNSWGYGPYDFRKAPSNWHWYNICQNKNNWVIFEAAAILKGTILCQKWNCWSLFGIFYPLTDANKIKLTWNLLTGVLHLTRFHMSPNKDYWRSMKAMTPL